MVTVTSVYAPGPTECASTKGNYKGRVLQKLTLEDHLACLHNGLEQVNVHNIHLTVEDLNARVGIDSHLTQPEVIGHHCFYNTVELDSDHRIVSRWLVCSLRTTKRKSLSRPKLQVTFVRDYFQLQLSNISRPPPPTITTLITHWYRYPSGTSNSNLLSQSGGGSCW